MDLGLLPVWVFRDLFELFDFCQQSLRFLTVPNYNHFANEKYDSLAMRCGHCIAIAASNYSITKH
jgi:hypothetical protein